MTVKEIAISAAALLQADDIAELLAGDDAESDDDVKAILKSVATAVSELESEGICAVSCESVTAHNGRIPFSALHCLPLSVMRVSREGKNVRFETDNTNIRVDGDGEYTVEYRVRSGACELDDNAELGAAEADTVSYLAARNYCLMTGRTDDAAIWDEMYTRGLQNHRIARRARLPRRAWR